MTSTIENYEYFLSNIADLYKAHKGEFVLLQDCKAQGFFKTFDEAYKFAVGNGYELGKFIIQECVKDPDDNAAIFHSRVG